MNYYFVEPREDELYHYGVKGMKWGVRKVDYNTSGLKSDNVYRKINDLERQERGALRENKKNYKTNKKSFVSELKTQKKNKTITKEQYKLSRKQGINSAKQVLRNNNAKIRSNFNEAYFDKISAGEIAQARFRNNLGAAYNSVYGSSNYNAYFDANSGALKRAESRRNEFAQDYATRGRKKKG